MAEGALCPNLKFHDFKESNVLAAPSERWPPGQQLEGHAGHSPGVGVHVRQAPVENLGRDVLRRAIHSTKSTSGLTGLGHLVGAAEVDEFDVPGRREYDVLRLDVSVDDVLALQVVNDFKKLCVVSQSKVGGGVA